MSFFKVLSLAITTLSFLSLANAAEKVDFSADRVHGLFVFVESISGTPHKHEDIRKLFESSKYNNPKSRQMLEEFRSLDFSFGHPIFSSGLPERNQGRTVKDAFIIQASYAKSIADFRERTAALLPLQEQSKLFKVLSYFDPIYNSLLWQPEYVDIGKAALVFKQRSVKWKLDDLFSRAVKFYASEWPAEQTFHVSLFPLPLNSKHTSATAYGVVESVGVIPGEDEESRFGVIFHELCHSLYETESLNTQKIIAASFKENPSKYSTLAYNYLNEALATAIGNGWAYQKAKGKLDPSEWYDDEKINGFAHALFPRVKEYLTKKKTIDAAFINFAIASFEKEFPNSLYEFQPALSDMDLITDGVINSRDLRKDLKEQFRVASINANSPINDDDTLKAVRSNTATVFAIVTQKQRGQLDSLDDVFKGLSEHIELLPKVGNFLAMFDVGIRKLIVLVVDNPLDVPKAFKIMSQKKKVDKMNTFVELKFMPPPPESAVVK